MSNLFFSDDDINRVEADLKSRLLEWDKRRFATIGVVILVVGYFGFTSIVSSIVRDKTDAPIEEAKQQAIRAEFISESITKRLNEIEIEITKLEKLSDEFNTTLNQKLDELSQRSAAMDSLFDRNTQKLTDLGRKARELEVAFVRFDGTGLTAGVVTTETAPSQPSACGPASVSSLIQSSNPSTLGCGEPLAEGQLSKLAETYGVDLKALTAFIDAQNPGAIQFAQNGFPLLVFERHVFYRTLSDPAARQAASQQQLASANWGDIPYPKTLEERQGQLREASKIDAKAAIRATSWGPIGLLGENYEFLGYESEEAFAKAMFVSGMNQYDAVLRFLEKREIIADLNARNWSAAVRKFNGSSQVTRLTGVINANYNQLLNDEIAGDRYELSPTDIANIQVELESRSLYSGIVDGIYGQATQRALRQFQTENGLPETGLPDQATLSIIKTPTK
ncbi:N-acetylmuramidase domain-containing protein [Shimia abyssi]|uniref:Putative peptidoglycan binding protein n=1 Tax=Shimia abyssi TaxID=1662395 RepID=A0A2P8FET5_9RHOB|nr:N-acetylmuramidase domain-containing protein [Shimia abyssi]PSL20219.1 putative peptidoglycan binding protein [Shimia abyssi]